MCPAASAWWTILSTSAKRPDLPPDRHNTIERRQNYNDDLPSSEKKKRKNSSYTALVPAAFITHAGHISIEQKWQQTTTKNKEKVIERLSSFDFLLCLVFFFFYCFLFGYPKRNTTDFYFFK